MTDAIKREAQIYKLAETVVENMSLNELMSFVYEELITLYSNDQLFFEEEWFNTFGEQE